MPDLSEFEPYQEPAATGLPPAPECPPFQGVITVIATATVVHPPGADLSALPDPTPVAGHDETENH